MAPKDDIPKANIGLEPLNSPMAINALDIAIGFRREKDAIALLERNSIQAEVAILDPDMVRQRIALLVHDVHQDGDFPIVRRSSDAAKHSAVGVTGKRISEIPHNSILFFVVPATAGGG